MKIRFIFIEEALLYVDILCTHPKEEEIEVNLTLSPFITDWSVMQSKFIAGIVDNFDNWLRIRPSDFRMTKSDSLGEVQCSCQLFAGACRIVLSPDFLRLSFARITRKDHSTVNEVLRRSMEWCSTDFSNHKQVLLSHTSNRHVEVVGGRSADCYLSQFTHKKVVDVMNSEQEIKCQPSFHLTLSDKRNTWELRRLLEISQTIEGGLFINTQIHLFSAQNMNFSGQKQLLEKLYRLADQSTGIEYRDNQ